MRRLVRFRTSSVTKRKTAFHKLDTQDVVRVCKILKMWPLPAGLPIRGLFVRQTLNVAPACNSFDKCKSDYYES